MARQHEFGQTGEQLAASWLQENGHHILHHNWRHPFGEIDCITQKDGILHFIEIKSGNTNKFGPPESRAGKTKLRKTMRAANAWLYQNKQHGKRIQFDVLAISVSNNGISYDLFQDVSL